MRERLTQWRESLADAGGSPLPRIAGVVVLLLLLLLLGLSFWWSAEPDLFDVNGNARDMAAAMERPVVVGSTTTSALILPILSMMPSLARLRSSSTLVLHNSALFSFLVPVLTRYRSPVTSR